MEAPATATPSPRPVAAEGSPRASSQQWDVFEVVLSKPSGRQKLGMVLKHAQVVGEKKTKRGAYLAGLAEGPSVAQDLGLTPKDRLISVEGLDVKTLPFDRIVALIRKASFPLTLIWSRQRKDGVRVPENLPGTAVVAGARRAVESRVLEVPPASTSSDIEPCPDAAAGGAGRKPASEAVNGSTASVGPPLGSLGSQFRPSSSSSSGGATWHSEENKRQQHQQQQQQHSLTAGSSCGVASSSTAGDGGAHKGGVFPDGGTCVVDSSFSDGNNAASSLNQHRNLNHNVDDNLNLAYVAEEWIRTTTRGRATARATREAEVLGDGGTGSEARRASTGMPQVQQRNPHQDHLERLEQQYRHQQPPGTSMRQPVHHSRQRQPWPHSMMPPTQRMPHWQQQSQQERQLQRGGGGGSMSIGSGNSSSGSGLPLSEPAAGAVSGVIRHQEVGTNVVPLPPPPANPSWVQGSAAATTTAGGADGGDEGGVSEAGVGCREKKVEAVVLKEREAEALAMREAMRARRRERDKARREKVRREIAAGGTMRMLHDRRQQAEGQGGAIPGVIGGGGGQQPLNRPHRGAFGKGKLGGGIGAGVVGARALEIEEGGGLLASAASAAGAPEWLNPLVKAELRDFPGTRHCRSRLKKIFCHEWVQQEYYNGVSTGQVDPTMPQMEFLRRRMGSGRLYALLLEDSKDYLRPGVYTDTDVELALIAQEAEKVHAMQMPRVDADGAAGGSNKWKPDVGVSDSRAATAAALGQDLPSGVMRAAGGNGGSSCSKAGSHGVSWAERLRNFQIDVPTTTYDLTSSDETEGVGVGVDSAGARGTGETDRGVGVVGGKGGDVDVDVDVVEWDGQGVDASVVIQHRRRFDARCCAYEALINASRNDKTSIFMERAQRLHQDHAAIITAKRATLEGTLENVRSQLLGREDQLHQLRMEQSHINPMDGASIAAFADNEAAILSRITEKKLQMSMILEEASKVVDWDRTAELARREAMQRAADVHGHGHGGAFTAESAREKNDLVQAMMSQKATILLLTTLCKIPGPWLAPNGHVRRHPSAGGGGGVGAGIMGGMKSAAASSVRKVPLGNPLGYSDEKSSEALNSTATIANNSSSSSRSILIGSPNPNPSSATGGMQICSSGVGGSGISSSDDRINNKNSDRINKSCGSSYPYPGSGKRGNGYEGQQQQRSDARHPLTPQGKPEPKPSEQQRPTANNSPPEQKIKSIKLRLRTPSSSSLLSPRSSSSSSSKDDRPVTVTDPAALLSAPDSTTEADVTAAAATADEGGGRGGGDGGASTSAITRRRSHKINFATASTTTPSPRALWDSVAGMGAVMARGGKEAAMARMAAENRAVEEAAVAEAAAGEEGGVDDDDDDGNDDGNYSGEDSDRAMKALGADDDGARGRGGTSGSGSESEAVEDGYDEYHGHDEDNEAGEGGGSTIDGMAMEEGYQGEDGIGPLSFQLAGSSCGSDAADAGEEEEEEGSGAEIND